MVLAKRYTDQITEPFGVLKSKSNLLKDMGIIENDQIPHKEYTTDMSK